MIQKIKKHQQLLLILMIVVCIGTILLGGLWYVNNLRSNLQENAIQNVMTVTAQQERAFDNFITMELDRMHGYADFFSENDHSDPVAIKHQLSVFSEADAIYSVACLDEGWFCSNAADSVRQLEPEDLEFYRSLEGVGVRDTFTSIITGQPMFGFYEAFTFPDGHRGLIQKSYDRTKITETFSLSFYNDQGLAFVVNQRGDILLRSVGQIGDRIHTNIFDIVTDIYGDQADIDSFANDLAADATGYMVFVGERSAYLYSYIPIKAVDSWFLVSIVPTSAISEETGRMLQNSRLTLIILILVVVVFIGLFTLMWRTHKQMADLDRKARYHAKLFEIFISFLSNSTNDVYAMMDHKSNKLEYVSPNVERVLGIKAANLVETLRAADYAADPLEAAEFHARMENMAPGETIDSRSTERVHAVTGEHLHFVENFYCVDVEGQLKRVIYLSDRTEEWKSRDNLAAALQMAQAASEAKTAFLGSVSHDIRTPMNAIIGFLTLIQDEADDPNVVREYAHRIDAASQHLLGLINNVLDMNKIESGNTTLNIDEMDLAVLIDEINNIIRPRAKSKDQTFDIIVSHLEHEHLMGDKLRINQILINLLSNSVKYTPEGGHLQLRVEELPRVVDNYSRIRFTVSDDGLGMSEEYLKVIFEPFSREQTGATKLIQGTGLGMAITKSLVDLMGGTIQVVSKLDHGSTFTVELELRIQEQKDDDNFWIEHKVIRMIVADDDEDVCQYVAKTMAQTGVVTDYATDGETAMRMMREHREAGEPYDLILLDWQMPTLNGLETARLIRKNYSEKIPILILTAYDWSDIEQEAMEVGVNHFMPKPFFISTFKEAISRVMGGMKKEETNVNEVLKDKHILVVDDIEVNRIILVKLLESQGATCDIAANGQEAVDKFKENEYDVILMDVQMPVMDGYTATRTIRASGHPLAKSVPIIAMTANAFVDDVRNAIESGMDAHVAKPVQLDKIKSTIQQVLDGKKGELPEEAKEEAK